MMTILFMTNKNEIPLSTPDCSGYPGEALCEASCRSNSAKRDDVGEKTECCTYPTRFSMHA